MMMMMMTDDNISLLASHKVKCQSSCILNGRSDTNLTFVDQ